VSATSLLIAEDDYLVREGARAVLDAHPRTQVLGTAGEPKELLDLLAETVPDVVLLDIRMPGDTGLNVADALRSLPQQPAVIFTTAYPDHAVEAFELAAADYLVKPFDGPRLRRALDRALRTGGDDEDTASPSGRSTGESLGRIPVQRGDRTVLVDERDIVYASAERGYSYLKLADDRVLTSFSLADLERRLSGQFFRSHRSHLVNLQRVRELVPDFRGSLVLVMDDAQSSRVEVSRRQARELRRRLGI
jgi:DNA-binding LytR/AlgR family response regulator